MLKNQINYYFNINKKRKMGARTYYELADELKCTRQGIYFALSGKAPRIEIAIKKWLKLQEKESQKLPETFLVVDKNNFTILVEKYGFLDNGYVLQTFPQKRNNYELTFCVDKKTGYFYVKVTNELNFEEEIDITKVDLNDKFYINDMFVNLGFIYDLMQEKILIKK